MRRAKLILVSLAVVVSAFAAFSGSAMADDLNCHNARGDLVRCDGDLYTPYDNNDYYNPYYSFYNPNFNDLYYSPYGYSNNYSSCPFWGDFEGPVNQSDCF